MLEKIDNKTILDGKVITRAVLYARVSTDDTRKDGRNLAGQIEMGREYAAKKGYNVTAELSEDERGASGAKLDLPQLQQVRKLAANDEFDVLIVREMDRLSRDFIKQMIVEQELQNYGIRIEYILADYPNTPEGQLQKQFRAMIAEYERAKTRERTVRAKNRTVQNGKPMFADVVLYGYRMERDKAVIYEDEAQVVRLVYDYYLQGLSIKKVVNKLNEIGAPLPKLSEKKAARRKTKGWSAGTISDMLKNKAYTGIWTYNKRSDQPEISIEIPAIISRETFEAARVQAKKNTRTSKRNRKYDYLLVGRCRCGQCDRAVVGKRKNARLSYYVCSNPERCKMRKHFNVDRVDTALWRWIKGFLLDRKRLKSSLKAYQRDQHRLYEPIYNRQAIIDDLLSQHQAKLDRLLDLYLDGKYDKDILETRKLKLEATISKLRNESSELQLQLDATLTDNHIATIIEFTSQTKGALDEIEKDYESKRTLLDLLDLTVRTDIVDGEQVLHIQCYLVKEAETVSIADVASGRASMAHHRPHDRSDGLGGAG